MEKQLPFPLIRATSYRDDAESITFTVFRDEANAPQDKTKHSVPIFDAGTPEDWLEFRTYFAELAKNKGFTDDGTQLFWHMGQLLRGDAEEQFNTLHTSVVDELNNPPEQDFDQRSRNVFNRVLEEVTKTFMSTDIAQSLRKGLFHVKKPYSMTVAAFMIRLRQLSAYLPVMPNWRGFNRALTTDELQTILETAVPVKWQEAYVLSGQSHTMTLVQTVDYFRRLEAKEGSHSGSGQRTPKGTRTPRSNNNNNRRGSRRGKNPGSSGGGSGGGGGGRGPGGGRGGGGGHQHYRSGGGGRGGGGSQDGPPAGGGRGNHPNNNNNPRRSTRNRGPWCHICRTTEHDYADCPRNPNNQRSSQGQDAHNITSGSPTRDPAKDPNQQTQEGKEKGNLPSGRRQRLFA